MKISRTISIFSLILTLGCGKSTQSEKVTAPDTEPTSPGLSTHKNKKESVQTSKQVESIPPKKEPVQVETEDLSSKPHKTTSSEDVLLAGGDTNTGSGIAISGGGTAIDCQESGIFLLDFWEEGQRMVKIDLPGQTYDQKVLQMLDRLEKLSPLRAAVYRKWYKTFFDETSFVPSGNLGISVDTGPVPLPKASCKLKPIAAQLSLRLPGDPRYYISLPDWKALSENDKAGLIFHELIYREQMESTSHKVSSTSLLRYMNLRLATSTVIEEVKTDKAKAVLFQNLGYFESKRGYAIELGNWENLRFYENGDLKYGHLLETHINDISVNAYNGLFQFVGSISEPREDITSGNIITRRGRGFDKQGFPLGEFSLDPQKIEFKTAKYNVKISLDRSGNLSYDQNKIFFYFYDDLTGKIEILDLNTNQLRICETKFKALFDVQTSDFTIELCN